MPAGGRRAGERRGAAGVPCSVRAGLGAARASGGDGGEAEASARVGDTARGKNTSLGKGLGLLSEQNFYEHLR